MTTTERAPRTPRAIQYAHRGTPLSPAELAVLRLVADGRTNPYIAHERGISEDTVKTHMRRIMSKLGARDRTHAVILAQLDGELPCTCQTRSRGPR